MSPTQSSEMFPADSEIAVLSILLNNPDMVYSVVDLRPHMMSSMPNTALLETIIELSSQNLVPDPSLIESYLKSSGALKTVGDTAYIKFLVDTASNKDNFKEYQQQVINAYKKRTLISMATKVPSMITGTDISTVISQIRNSLDDLTAVSGGGSTVSIGSVIKEVYENIKLRMAHSGIRGTPFGVKSVDMMTGGIAAGDLWIIAGRPSQGKTAMACNSIINSAKEGVKSLVFSFEMSRDAFIERLIAIDTKISISSIRLAQLSPEQLEKIGESAKRIKELPIYIDSCFTADIGYLDTTIRKYRQLHNIDTVYVDYVQLMAERNEQSTHEIGRISRRLKLLANELGIGAVLLSQLNREVEHRDDRRPIMSDLRQSGNLEEDADLIAGLYRDEYYFKDSPNKGTIEFIIRKQRNGPIGTIYLNFVDTTNVVTDKVVIKSDN